MNFQWAACGILVLFSANLPLAAGQGVEDALVRVFVKRVTQGLIHEGRFIPEARVQEVLELSGVLVEGQGLAVAYVGHHLNNAGRGDTAIQIQTRDGRRLSARLIGVDERVNLALFQSRDLVGPSVRMTNLPKEGRLRLVVSSDGRWTIADPTVLKVSQSQVTPDLAVQVSGLPGVPAGKTWDGGLLMDPQGRFVGIAVRSTGHPFSKKIQILEVLPSDLVWISVKQIRDGGNGIPAGWLGILLERSKPPAISHVLPGSPAERAGLMAGDVIQRLDGRPVEDTASLVRAIRSRGEGGLLELSVLRSGLAQTVSATLGIRPDAPQKLYWNVVVPKVWESGSPQSSGVRIFKTPPPTALRLGFDLIGLSPQLAEFFKCPQRSGLLVRSVVDGSPAQKVGFRAGDVLIRVSGRKMSTLADLQVLLEEGENAPLEIEFIRDGRTLKLTLIRD